MEVYDKYEVIIGLEVHTQLLTKTKAYSADIAEYGGSPNTFVSPVTLGQIFHGNSRRCAGFYTRYPGRFHKTDRHTGFGIE